MYSSVIFSCDISYILVCGKELIDNIHYKCKKIKSKTLYPNIFSTCVYTCVYVCIRVCVCIYVSASKMLLSFFCYYN